MCLYQLGNTLVRAFIFILCQSFRELTHIFHCDFITLLCSVDSACDVAKFTISKSYQRVRYGLYSGYLCQVHCQILVFGKIDKTIGLWFQYKAPP